MSFKIDAIIANIITAHKIWMSLEKGCWSKFEMMAYVFWKTIVYAAIQEWLNALNDVSGSIQEHKASHTLNLPSAMTLKPKMWIIWHIADL
jgi:hypothetical protein